MDIGVPGGQELLRFATAIIGSNRAELDAARSEIAKVIGLVAVSAASAVAANFTKNDRIANGCGIPSEPMMLKATKDIRADLGINDYRSAVNTFRHFPEER